MQKLITILISLLLCSLCTTAQTGWQWGKRGGGGSAQSGYQDNEDEVQMVTDKNGNLYVLAKLAKGGTPNIDGYASTNTNDQLSLTKWDCSGTRKWTKFFGAPHLFLVHGNALGIDTLGGIYLTGATTTSGYFNTDTTLSASNLKQWWIAKYDTAGNFKWLRMPQADTVTYGFGGTASQSGGLALDVAPNGDVYMLSRLAPGIFGGSYANSAHGIHLLRFSKDGNLLSGKPVAITCEYEPVDGSIKIGNLVEERFGFARDHRSGSFYMSGLFYSPWGNLSFGSTPLVASGTNSPMYLAAFDSSGNHLWVEQSSPDKSAGGMYSRPGIDEFGNIYLSGGTSLGNSFLGHTDTNTYTSIGGAVYLLSVDKSGNLRWAKNAGYRGPSSIRALSYANGIVSISDMWGSFLSWDADTLTGSLTNYASYLARFNAHTGMQIKRIDTCRITGAGSHPADLTTDIKGNLYIGGGFKEKVFLPSGTLTSVGGAFDFFVAKYGPSNCNCTVAVPNFSNSSASGSTTVSFTYTGSTPIDSVRWEFGDGTLASGLTASHSYSATGTYGVSIVVYNSCGIVVYYKDVTTGSGSTGIHDQDEVAAVSVYPNPATESIIIEGAGMGTVLELYSSIGQRVLSTTITQDKQSVNVSALSDGMYIVRFTTKDDRRGSVKILKQ